MIWKAWGNLAGNFSHVGVMVSGILPVELPCLDGLLLSKKWVLLDHRLPKIVHYFYTLLCLISSKTF